ncbi:MAG: hypothetical protein EP308_00890 [Burkholderiales bacterium]|nr:MAG: hypothetical protein EP308_00890 [Burkholderiales bacterium]
MPARTLSKVLPSAMLLAGACLLVPATAQAQSEEPNSSIAACLKAWGKHPFGSNPAYRTLSTSVKVFGIGQDTVDKQVTAQPALVLINPGVNVMGGSAIELLNPRGWYCMRTTVNVMGGMEIRVHCDARLALTSDGTTVLGNNPENKGVTVMGSTRVERVGCGQAS